MSPDLSGSPAPEPEWLNEKKALINGIERALEEIALIERRLGTPREMPGDMERAAELAHRVNNLRTSLRLGSGLCGKDDGTLKPLPESD